MEAKKNDVENGLGQCAAQQLGAQRFNQRDNILVSTLFGCVTTGDIWQFLRLSENALVIDTARYYITDLGVILRLFLDIVASA